MVGIGTVLADDPMLDTRRQKDRTPIRIVCDTHLDIPLDCKIIKSAGQIRTIIAAGEEASEKKKDKIRALEVEGAEVILVPESYGKLDLCNLVLKIGSMGISGVMVEGGGRLAWGFIREGLVNEVVTFTAPKIFGGAGAITPVEGEGIDKIDEALPFHLVDSEILPGGDIYARYIIGPEPEDEGNTVEILPAEPVPIRHIEVQENKMIDVSSVLEEQPQVTVNELNEKLQEAKKQEAEKLEAAKAKVEKATAKKDDGWSTADNIPVTDVEEKPVELETRIVTEVLSADLNPFNIDSKKDNK
jgi:diaminohydroxyphosphoribosylaminopyrimidine deaminase/5-amino-6-(5-phosphoribosylamino)uracil reductase